MNNILPDYRVYILMFYLSTANWLKAIKKQSFISNSLYESDNDGETEEVNHNANANTSRKVNTNYNLSHNSPKITKISILDNTDGFVVEDPYVEVKDDDIEYVDDELVYDRNCREIHLKNGLVLSGEFRKKKRVGYGMLSGPALERRGNNHTGLKIITGI